VLTEASQYFDQTMKGGAASFHSTPDTRNFPMRAMIGLVGQAIEAVAVVIIVIAIVHGTVRYLLPWRGGEGEGLRVSSKRGPS
jgi:hypothetical protein